MRLRRAQTLLGLRQSLEGFQRPDMGNIQLLGGLGQKRKELRWRHRHRRSANSQERLELRDISLTATHEGRGRNRHWHETRILTSEKHAVKIWIRLCDDRYSIAPFES